MTKTGAALATMALVIGAAGATPAWAQPDTAEPGSAEADGATTEPAPADAEDVDSGGDVELDDSDALGVDENPGLPEDVDQPVLEPEPEAPAAEEPQQRDPYPRAWVDRPLTLPQGMSELQGEGGSRFNPWLGSMVLYARHGVWDDLEITFAYGPGSADSEGVAGGRVVEPRAIYRPLSWAGVSLAFPLMVDPIRAGIRVGVPVQITLWNRIRVYGGRDLVSFKLRHFVPSLGEAPLDEGQVAPINYNLVQESKRGTELPAGALRVIGGVAVQINDGMTVAVEGGVIAQDFSSSDPMVPLTVRWIHSYNPALDVGVQAGYANLDRAAKSFGAALFASYRTDVLGSGDTL